MDLNTQSVEDVIGAVVIRQSDRFVNHLFITPGGWVCKAIVGINTKTRDITISFSGVPEVGIAARVASSLWGKDHWSFEGVEIAGSCRRQMREDRDKAVEAVLAALTDMGDGYYCVPAGEKYTEEQPMLMRDGIPLKEEFFL